jgi:GNAT superfamily N-acetyltransferase
MRQNAPDPVSLLMLGQFGVDLRHQQHGLGRALMADVFRRAKLVAQHAGFRALGTHPIDAAAEGFYAKLGFRLMPHISPALMLIRTTKLP